MTTHQLSLNECNTPWWYETPSLASQSTFSSNTYCTGTSQIDPFDITPSQSSGYYDEDTTASEASSNLFTGGPGSCATGSEWSDNGSSMRSVIKSTRSSHHRPSAVAGGAEGGACLCEHCASHSGAAHTRVHHGQNLMGRYESQTQTQTSEHFNTSEVLVAPVSPTAPLASFNSMEMSNLGPTPSTCTELNGLVDSQDGLNGEENRHSGEYYESSPLSDGEQRGSQLSHSMASTNQQILRELARDLMQHIDSIKLFPYLQRNSLLSDDDMEYICNPRRTENERRRRIIISAPCRDPDAFDRFVDCLSVERSHPGHTFLAKRMKEAIKKKRENPFKTMSSLRKKRGTSGRHHSESDAHSVRRHPDDVQDQLSSSAQSSPKHLHSHEHDLRASSKSQSPRLQTSANNAQQRSPSSSVKHGVSSGSTKSSSPRFSEKEPSPSPYEIPIPSVTPASMASHITASSGQQPHYSRRSPSSSSGVSSYTHTPSTYQFPPDEQEATLSEEEYERSFYKRDHFDSYNQSGGYSSLPRQFSNSTVSSLSRCSPAYSSARYQAEQKRKAKSLNRHGSFHTHDMSPAHLVSPLTRSTATNDSSVPLYHQPHPHSHEYQRKYSLPVTTQHGPTFTTTVKSHSGSQLPNVRSSPYPPLQEDMGSAQIHNHSCTQGEYLVSDTTLTEYGFSPFDSQWETQNMTTHPPQQYELLGHNYERQLQSLNDSRSRHPSLPPETSGFNSQHPSLQPDDYFPSITDLQSSVDELSLQSHQSTERTHRRSRSCDASKAQQEGLVPSPPEEVKSRHHSLIRRQHRPSYEEVKRERIAGKETGDAKLIKRKILWLQERVQFTEFFEELNFLSLTHYHHPRNILYSGTLYEHGKPRFVVLLTDMLLILKPKKKMKMNVVQSKLGVQLPQLDWFSDLGCKAKRPFFLHLMMVQRKLKKYSSECFSVRYNNRSEMVEITFQAVSKEAKEIWVESLSQAIRTCTEDNANSILPVGKPSASNRQGGQPYTTLSLTVLQANNLALSSSNCKTRNHYCGVHLGSQKCRTPSVKAKCWPSWNFQLVFSNFALTETVHVGFYAERTTCPDDFLGNVEIDLTTLAQSQRRQLQQSMDRMSKLLFKNQVYPLMNGKGTLTFDIELGWETNL